MAQCLATFGSTVTVIQRSQRLFEATGGGAEAAQLLQTKLEEDGVQFRSETTIAMGETLRGRSKETVFLMKVILKSRHKTEDFWNANVCWL